MPKCDVHANWLKLMLFCQKAGHGEMTLTFADGVPVFAKTVMVQMRFGAVHQGSRPEGTAASGGGAELQETREPEESKR